MVIKVNEQFYIESDERNYILKQIVKRKAKDGKGTDGSGYNYYEECFYYWKLENLCDAIIDKAAKASDVKSWQELKELVTITKFEIESCVTGEPLKNLSKFLVASRAGEIVESSDVPIRAKRGRKPGSKNKPKV